MRWCRRSDGAPRIETAGEDDRNDSTNPGRPHRTLAAGRVEPPADPAPHRRSVAAAERHVAGRCAERVDRLRRQHRGASAARAGAGGVGRHVVPAPRATAGALAFGSARTARRRAAARVRRAGARRDAAVRVAARPARGGVGGRDGARRGPSVAGGAGCVAGTARGPGCSRRSGVGGGDDAGAAGGLGRRLAAGAPHRQPDAPARDDGGRRRRPGEPVLSFLGTDEHRRRHTRRFLSDQRGVRAVPPRHLRAVGLVRASFLVVQQPVVPPVHRVHAGRGRHPAVEVVRGMPRSRRVLQRALRPADPGADRHAGGAGGARLHVVPCDRARRRHDGAGRLHRRVSAAPRPGRERGAAAALGARSGDRAGPGAAPAHVPEAVPPRGRRRVLLDLPQGPPGRARQRLPLDPRLQRVRQLAGFRGVGAGRAVVLLPGDAADLQRLPHAAGAVGRSGGGRRLRALAPLPGRQHGVAVRQRRRRAVAGRAGFSASGADLGRRLRHHASGRGRAAAGAGRPDRRAAVVEHLRGRRGVGPLRSGGAW